MKRFLVAVALALPLAACSVGVNNTKSFDQPPVALYDPAHLPAGPLGASIRYGHDLIANTPKLMGAYVRADMACAACHIDAGTKARGGTFLGTYARFPQWNRRAHRVIALQDRLAECFLYSMNGKPPAYSSREMVAMVAYIAWLSQNTRVGQKQAASDSFIEPLPARSPNPQHGAQLYAQKCAACHGAGGAGVSGTFPPLWGDRSFNNGAGMAHIDRMTGFVHFNMPQNAPGTLSLDDAYDVSAFVLSHARPKFNGDMLVSEPPLPAKYY